MVGSRKSILSTLLLEITPAALFGTAVGVAASVFSARAAQPMAPILAGAAAFLGAWWCLKRVDSGAVFRLPEFDEPLEPIDADEAQIDEVPPQPVHAEGAASEQDPPGVEDMLPPPPTQSDPADELLLEDVIASLGSESRVVRLFPPQQLPTPGELQTRIDHHLRLNPPQGASPDATQALHEAIADLRRSLR